ncbi:exonuclease SbcCD subunit D [Microbacteriaceae bacterium 4G12]
MRKLTFIHAADLHLDSPFKGMETSVPPVLFERMKESTFRSFSRIVDKAIQEQVDFVVLSGDLYDAETRSLRAQVFVREQLRRLHTYHIPVYIIHGNHDHLGGSWAAIEFPDNVHVFCEPYVEKKPFYKNGELYAYIYGFSYHQKAVTENMTAQYTKDDSAIFHIGMLHGSLDGNTDHSRYAPFLLRELLEKQFDYWALGHIHKRSILSLQPPIVYPGNIQGRHRKESGEKGCYLVSLTEQEAAYTFLSTADVIWEEAVISIEGMETVDELLQCCYETIANKRHETNGVLLTLTFSGCGIVASHLQDVKQVEDMIHIVSEGEEREDFVWIVKWINQTVSDQAWEQMKQEHHFLGDLLQEAESFLGIEDILRPIWGSSAARKTLVPFTAEECEEIRKEAERLLVQELLVKGGE